MPQILLNEATPNGGDLDANISELYSGAAWSATGFGYAAGAGGTVTQLTSKSTSVTINKPTGQITMNAAALAAGARVQFQVFNSLVSPTDVVYCVPFNNLNYEVQAATSSGAGSFYLTVKNASGGSLSEALVLNFVLYKGRNA